MCKVIIKTREALSVTSERLFNSLTLVMFLSHIVCYMFQFRVIQSFSAQYNKRRNKQKDITKTNFRDVRMSKNKLKRIGIIGIISSRIGIIFILICGQNNSHYSHSFQNNHTKIILGHFLCKKGCAVSGTAPCLWVDWVTVISWLR